MKILALDLASRTGYCFGDTNKIAVSAGSMLLLKASESLKQAPANLAVWLDGQVQIFRPEMIALESWVIIVGHSNSSATEIAGYLHGAARAVASLHGISIIDYPVSVWRKSFLGRSSFAPRGGHGRESPTDAERKAGRALNKEMTLRRAITLKMLPKDSVDTDAADACGIFIHAVIDNKISHKYEFALWNNSMH